MNSGSRNSDNTYRFFLFITSNTSETTNTNPIKANAQVCFWITQKEIPTSLAINLLPVSLQNEGG